MKQWKVEVSKTDPITEWDEQRELWIETLSHMRHDWLNDLQLIVGYVQLKKYDKLTAYVDMLKQRLGEEGRVSKFGDAGLVEALVTYRAAPKSYSFLLSVGETADLRAAPQAAREAERIVRAGLSAFERAAALGIKGADNKLECRLSAEPAGLHILYTYEGSYDEPELRRLVEELSAESIEASVAAQYQGGGAALSVVIPM